MHKKSILVTGIGGNVGQGILRNILQEKFPVRVVGTNTEVISSGTHLVHALYKVPYAYEEGYLKRIIEICRIEKIDLIIPATDYETYYLTLARSQLPSIASSDAEVNQIFLDKYKTAKAYSAAGIIFAPTVLPSQYQGQWKDVVVKPREGRGSRGLAINPPRISEYPDTYVVQELLKGVEITVSFYVTRKDRVIGNITFARELYSGMTARCFVTFDYEAKVHAIITAMVKHFKIRGSCNIQAIVSAENEVVPFEINGRISGTNSIRSQFGFPDVKWTVEEYLFDKEPKKPNVKKGAAIRMLMDVIYPGIELSQIENSKTKHYIF
jgi:carbamoyl-phosphate synthase large subunit